MRACSSLVAVLLLAACQDTVVVGGLENVAELKAIPNRELDLLFVVDNSPSMADTQASLAANFPRMVEVLSQLDGGMPALHIGVITTDMGTSSTALPVGSASIGSLGQGGCAHDGDRGTLVQGSSVTDRFISDVDGVRNYTGELTDVFTEIAMVGDGGCGFEQPLAALRLALLNPANAGFLRPSANLAVVFVGDEDDCSASDSTLFAQESPALGPLESFRCFRFGVECDEDINSTGIKTDCRPRMSSPYIEDVAPFVDVLTSLKPDPRMVMVAGIVGDLAPVEVVELPPVSGLGGLSLSPSCVATDAGTGQPSEAFPAIRLGAFISEFAPRATMTSICNADLASPITKIASSAKRLMNDPCLDTTRLADADAALPGIQPSCEVVDVRDSQPDAPSLLAPCSSGAADCFELVSDQIACPFSDDHLRVAIRRTSAVADDTWSQVRCQPAP